jgi:cysteine desulfurase/selenocysteine lyase
MDRIAAHEHDLLRYATEAFAQLKGVAHRRNREGQGRRPVVHPPGRTSARRRHHSERRRRGRAYRPSLRATGDAALRRPATARASFYLYNTFSEVDALVAGIRRVQKIFG